MNFLTQNPAVLAALITGSFVFGGAIVAGLVALIGQRTAKRQAAAANATTERLNQNDYWKDVATDLRTNVIPGLEKRITDLRTRNQDQRDSCDSTTTTLRETIVTLAQNIVGENLLVEETDRAIRDHQDHEHDDGTGPAPDRGE